MSTHLLIDDRGLVTLEVEDAQGETFSYTVTPVVAPFLAWCVEVERTCSPDDKDHGPYRVSLATSGAWGCTCKDCKYKGHLRPCKHVAALKPLYRFLRSLLPQEVSA